MYPKNAITKPGARFYSWSPHHHRKKFRLIKKPTRVRAAYGPGGYAILFASGESGFIPGRGVHRRGHIGPWSECRFWPR